MFYHILQKYLRYLRVLLVIRHYFKNYLPICIIAFLSSKRILPTKNIKCICKDNSKHVMPLKLYILLSNGLFEGLFRDIRCKDGVAIAKNFRIPFNELLSSHEVLEALKYGWRYDGKLRCWYKNNCKFIHIRHYLLEVFNYGEYERIDVNDKVAVDIGAGYGETSIYFLKSARAEAQPPPAHRRCGRESRGTQAWGRGEVGVARAEVLAVSLGCGREGAGQDREEELLVGGIGLQRSTCASL
jgi:hypothetical protein